MSGVMVRISSRPAGLRRSIRLSGLKNPKWVLSILYHHGMKSWMVPGTNRVRKASMPPGESLPRR